MPSRKILNSVEFYRFFFKLGAGSFFRDMDDEHISVLFFLFIFTNFNLWFFVLKYHSDCFILHTSIKVWLLRKFLCKRSNSQLKLMVQDFCSKYIRGENFVLHSHLFLQFLFSKARCNLWLFTCKDYSLNWN